MDGRTNERTNERTDGRTEIWTPISHPAISRCDKNDIILHDDPNAMSDDYSNCIPLAFLKANDQVGG